MSFSSSTICSPVIQTAKKILREVMRSRRKVNSLATEQALAAQRHLIASTYWKEADAVALYVGVKDELFTDLLLEEAWQSGRKVWLPRLLPHAPGQMVFALCTGRDELIAGPFGLSEPMPLCPAFGPDTAEQYGPPLLILPGLAFDRKGRRLGYGGGFYDRFLESSWSCTRVGLCFGFQLLPEVPVHVWDKRVHCLCTEEGFQCL